MLTFSKPIELWLSLDDFASNLTDEYGTEKQWRVRRSEFHEMTISTASQPVASLRLSNSRPA